MPTFSELIPEFKAFLSFTIPHKLVINLWQTVKVKAGESRRWKVNREGKVKG